MTQKNSYRINVVGTSGSGKSTFSKLLAERLTIRYIEMDALFWKKDWQQSNDEEFFTKLNDCLDDEHWVLDGNYSRTTPIKWAKVNTIIWLDYSFIRTIYQVTKRSINRALNQKEIWSGTGNKESLKKSFFSRDSIIHWAMITYFNNKRRYQKIMKAEELQHIEFIRLTSPKQTKDFLAKIAH